MKILFLTLLDFDSYSEHNIYCDLLREFIGHGHDVYCISPSEKRFGKKTHLEENGHLLKLRVGNMQKTNIIEKGISTLTIEPRFKAAVKKYFSKVKFDFVLYSTPPITLLSAIRYVKRRDSAKTYLLLKDIFPQNAVDLGMLQTSFVKGLLYRYFRSKEKKLYAISDRIGCMSRANADYLLKNNPELSPEAVEICPNAIEVRDMRLNHDEKLEMRRKYGIPTDKSVFVYGGNLGKPQGIPFVIDCLRAAKNIEKAYFLIVGDGTEYEKLEAFVNKEAPSNVRLMKRLPKDDYDRMIVACDIGMVFLDHRFTIPNFPSRLLAYMQAKLPILAVTDPNTDVGKVIVGGGVGWWVESDNADNFAGKVEEIVGDNLISAGNKAYQYLLEHYTVESAYQIIVSHM